MSMGLCTEKRGTRVNVLRWSLFKGYYIERSRLKVFMVLAPKAII
jgi:hypothetical protein